MKLYIKLSVTYLKACLNCRTIKKTLKSGPRVTLKNFFNFEYYFFSHFRQVEIIQFNIVYFKHFQKKGWVFMRKVFSLSLNDEKDRDIVEFLDSLDKGYRTMYLKIAIRTYMKLMDSEMEDIENEMRELQ